MGRQESDLVPQEIKCSTYLHSPKHWEMKRQTYEAQEKEAPTWFGTAEI